MILSGSAVSVPTVADEHEEIAALRMLLDDLLEYTKTVPDETKTPRGKRYEVVRIKAIVTLALHTHRLGEAVRTLLDAGFGIEIGPTARAVFEHGLTAHWLHQYGDEASYGFAAEAQRQRRSTGETLRKLVQIQVLKSDDTAEVLRLIAEDMKREIEKTSATPGGRSFQARCQDFVHGDAYYFAYRVLSEYVHPGFTISEAYVESHDPVSFQTEPRALSDPKTFLSNTCCGLLWAARAVDMLDRKHPNRDFLRRATKQLGVPLELTLSPEATLKRNQDRTRRKKAQRATRVAGPSG